MSQASTAWLGGFLLVFASIYFGAGFSLVVFQFPGARQRLNTENFDAQMMAPIRRATTTFTIQSTLQIIGGIVLAVAEWHRGGGYRYAPILYVLATAAAGGWTVILIFPTNRALGRAGDAAEFDRLLVHWIRLSTVRFGIWVVEWFSIALWVVAVAAKAQR